MPAPIHIHVVVLAVAASAGRDHVIWTMPSVGAQDGAACCDHVDRAVAVRKRRIEGKVERRTGTVCSSRAAATPRLSVMSALAVRHGPEGSVANMKLTVLTVLTVPASAAVLACCGRPLGAVAGVIGGGPAWDVEEALQWCTGCVPQGDRPSRQLASYSRLPDSATPGVLALPR